MQVDVFIIETGIDAVITDQTVDVSTGDCLDVSITTTEVETPTGEVIECVTGMDGARGKPARADLGFTWAGQLRPGEQLPGMPITAPTVFTDEASWGYARRPAQADAILTICNRDPSNIIGIVTWPAGQHEPVIALTGGLYRAERGDFLFPVGPPSADPWLADAGLTLAGDTVQ